MNEVKVFNPEDVMKNVKEKIRDSFVSLIPEEQWDSMVKKEIDSYFAKKDSYGNHSTTSNFQGDVYAVLKEEVNKKVKDYLMTNFNTMWSHSNGENICSSVVEDIIVRNSGKILTDMIGLSISDALRNAGYSMR